MNERSQFFRPAALHRDAGVTAGFSNLGRGTQRRYSTPFEGQQFVDNLSWVRGKHSLKFGAEARRSDITDQLRTSVSGNFSFNTLPTGLPGTAASGNGLASLLIGFPSAFSTTDTPPLDRSSWYLAAFVQDDWSVSKSLTLNLGMRWEIDTFMRTCLPRTSSIGKSCHATPSPLAGGLTLRMEKLCLPD